VDPDAACTATTTIWMAGAAVSPQSYRWHV
jgi:hypothetical protein